MSSSLSFFGDSVLGAPGVVYARVGDVVAAVVGDVVGARSSVDQEAGVDSGGEAGRSPRCDREVYDIRLILFGKKCEPVEPPHGSEREPAD